MRITHAKVLGLSMDWHLVKIEKKNCTAVVSQILTNYLP